MSEIIIAISLWCHRGVASHQDCKEELLACVIKDKRPGDSVEVYEKKLLECLVKK